MVKNTIILIAFKKYLFLTLSMFILCSCSTSVNNLNNNGDVNDPIESINRVTFAFNEAVDEAVLAPVAKGYRALFPRPVRKGISNFLSNLSQPWGAANSAFQGNFSNAGTAIGRFLINTTIGVLGIFDVATDMGLEEVKEDFGQTLGVAGVSSGPYIVIPLLGPSNARDVVGRIAGYFGDPVTFAMRQENHDSWIWIGTALRGITFREENLERIDNLRMSSVDFYATVRSLYKQRRNRMIQNESTDADDPFQDIEVE